MPKNTLYERKTTTPVSMRLPEVQIPQGDVQFRPLRLDEADHRAGIGNETAAFQQGFPRLVDLLP